jgi:hypothetical protein
MSLPTKLNSSEHHYVVLLSEKYIIIHFIGSGQTLVLPNLKTIIVA